MKNVFVSLLLASSVAFAAAPKVTCELSYAKVDQSGREIDFQRGQSHVVEPGKFVQAELKGFTLVSSLKQVCATLRGPCSDFYELSTTLAKGEVSTSTITSLNPNEYRQYLEFKVGRDVAFSICDIEAQ